MLPIIMLLPQRCIHVRPRYDSCRFMNLICTLCLLYCTLCPLYCTLCPLLMLVIIVSTYRAHVVLQGALLQTYRGTQRIVHKLAVPLHLLLHRLLTPLAPVST